jgi:hypothetical protein
VRTLIHRPSLLRACQHSLEDEHQDCEDQITLVSARTCVEASIRLVLHIHANFQDLRTTGAYWFNIFCACLTSTARP